MITNVATHPPTTQQRLAERERPDATAVMHQRWENILFVHWRWDPLQVQQQLPAGLTVDTYHGGAWIGVIPLFMRNVRPRFVPPLPLVSDFLELNVRTYVYDAQGHPGVYFFSLDCNQPLVVEAARSMLHLNYEHSVMSAEKSGDGWVDFSSERVGSGAKNVFGYRASGDARSAEPASLEFFLLERYRLFTVGSGGDPLSIRLHHPAHGLRTAEAYLTDPVAMRLAGFDQEGRAPDHICLADPVDVEVFLPEPAGVGEQP